MFFWIRFLSVLCGFMGAVGFYKSVKEISGQKLALYSVVIYSCVFRLVYHFQEGAEYALMIGNICWVTYFFIRTLKKMDLKNIVLFNIFSALAILSQYGTIILVITFAFFILLKTAISKSKNDVIIVAISYVLNFLFVLLPTYYFYMKYQLQMAYDERGVSALSVNINMLWDFIHGFRHTIRYNLFPNLIYQTNEVYMNFHFPNFIIVVLLSLFLILFFIAAIKILQSKKNIVIISMLKKPKSQKDMLLVYLIWSSVVAWLIFYTIVQSGLYSYGVFGFRWGLFITPLWLLTFIVAINEFLSQLKGSYKRSTSKIGNILTYIVIFLTTVYCLCGVYGVYKHWEKENTKGMVQKWYEIGGNKEKTILYYGAKFGFLYYLEKDERYNDSIEKNLLPMPWLISGDYYEYKSMFNKLLDNNYNYPVIYLCAAHTAEDIHTLLLIFKDKGYKNQIVYESYDATIYKLVKTKQ